MRVVHKFPLEIGKVSYILGRLSEVCHVGLQEGKPYVWAMVDPAWNEKTSVVVVGTGHDIPFGWVFAGSFQMPPFVWHLFYRPVPELS